MLVSIIAIGLPFSYPIYIGGTALIVAINIIFRFFSMTITDKRVYGRAFLAQVDLPLDSISSVAMGVKNISVSTASGVVRFGLIANSKEMHRVLSELIIARQNNKTKDDDRNYSAADEILKFKQLLDEGVISGEEFDEKKKQMLGL